MNRYKLVWKWAFCMGFVGIMGSSMLWPELGNNPLFLVAAVFGLAFLAYRSGWLYKD